MSTMHGMSWMMAGCGLIGILAVAALVLGTWALVKYLRRK